jgi:type IV pilus assembly protein PilY1
MKTNLQGASSGRRRPRPFQRFVAGLTLVAMTGSAVATTPLADQPIFSGLGVPGNLALALSVEFPTVVSVAHIDATYEPAKEYLGYFDPNKCYLYQYNANEAQRHFYPAGLADAHACTGTNGAKWSGNFLNWATMQTIDPFRWVLTGGYRSTDTATETILEKAWASGQGGAANFPNRTVTDGTVVADATPFDSWSRLRMRIQGLGNKMRITRDGDVNATPSDYDPGATLADGTTYELSVRVKVCDTSAGSGGVESNCVQYPNGNWKPVGLMQQYADRIRYSAFGYLNDDSITRDGGVLRARQKFVGPLQPVPGSLPVVNTAAEWNASTGVFIDNPDPTDAAATTAATGVTVNNSGVVNYLNKFGQISPGNFKTYDNVAEMYYAAIRYFKKQGNVPAWSSVDAGTTAQRARWVDGFPVITEWDDPIQYSCQRNFVLGIGDVNTHADRNLPGATGAREPTQPAEVAADTTVNALTATNKVGNLQGIGDIGATENYGGCCSNNGALMAGIAYDANTQDIRPDDPADLGRTRGRQSVQTYWLDVLEYQTFKPNNQFYLAAKFGGFNVPDGFDAYSRTTALPESWWRSNADTVGTQPRPDNYFIASRPDQVVAGLTSAFANIASKLRANTSAFATSMPQVAESGVASYATQFDAKTWTGELVASTSTMNATTGSPERSEAWRFAARLDAQAAGAGWDTGRAIATWNTATKTGVPFRLASLASAQQSALDTSYRSGNDASDYLNYLRGDRTHERASTVTGSARAYRDRVTLLGDIGAARARPVPPPTAPYSSSANPGYGAFKSAYAGRPTVVYFGTNAGMLHAVHGDVSGTNAGRELFAYVPGALFTGPTSTPNTNGLAALGNPGYEHRNYIDAPIAAADVDMGSTAGGSGTPDWRTILVGGLGKGGRAVYALDVTDPMSMTNETTVASKVLWEFTHTDLGYGYGEPAIVKTRKHGWAVIFGSGYNNADGKGYLFVVNPRNGELLEKIATGEGTTTSDAGLAHVQAYLLDRTDGTADAVYAGDLLGNLWRFDLSGTGTYPSPTKLATLTNGSNQALPVTTRPLIVVHPTTGQRWVTVGTGRLLHSSDVSSTRAQRFFAVQDGTSVRFASAADLPSTVSFPITTANLKNLTDLTQQVLLDRTSEVGWYVDLGVLDDGPAWRVIGDSTSFYGTVAFSAMVPKTEDACAPSGTNRVYAIDLASGQSRLTNASAQIVPFAASPLTGVVTDLRFYSVAGKVRLIAGTDAGEAGAVRGAWTLGTQPRRISWREVPLND